MCEALKELFADDLRESREQGIIEGRKFIWVAAIMILLPFVSSLVGIILGSIQLKKTSTKPVKIGVLLSCTGLVLHLLFRFVFKF